MVQALRRLFYLLCAAIFGIFGAVEKIAQLLMDINLNPYLRGYEIVKLNFCVTAFILSITSMTPAQAVTSADLSKVHIDSVIPLPATGMQAIQNNGQIVFVSANGRFVIRGELTDVWQKKSLTNINAIKDAATHLHLRGMGLEPNDLNRVRIGHGGKEVVVFVDPLCPHCHELMKKAETLGDKYTFQFIVIPALGDESAKLAPAISCTDEKKALSALINNQLASVTQEHCDQQRYKRTLLIGTLLNVQGVPFIVAPDGRFSQGTPQNLETWLIDGQE